MTVFDRVKSLFNKQSSPVPQKVNVVFDIKPLEYQKPDPKCKEHWDYIAIRPPTNNCNVCWAMYTAAKGGMKV